MRLLQINKTANAGSTGRICEGIGNVMMRHGWESYVAYGREMNSSSSHLIRIGDTKDLCLHVLRSRLLDEDGKGSKNATYALIERIKQIKPDIIHLHVIHGYFLNYAVMFEFLRSARIPIVWTLHDIWNFTGHCAFFDSTNCAKWKTECRDCEGLDKYPISLFKDNSTHNYKSKRDIFNSVTNMTLVPVSYWLSDLLDESFLCGFDKTVIHNGIDLTKFLPMDEKENIMSKYDIPGKKYILSVAYVWSKYKGWDDIVELRKILHKDISIVMVGCTRKQIKQLPVGIVGIERFYDQEELCRLYSSAELFVNLTYGDNYPTTNLEAIACGTPVITYKTGGSPESVTEDTGFVIEQGNIKKVYDIIINYNKNKTVVDACRQYAEKTFDQNLCFENYYDLYSEIIKRKGYI